MKSLEGVRFRKWATEKIKEYIIKGYTMDDERLKNLGGGNYFSELLKRIKDIGPHKKYYIDNLKSRTLKHKFFSFTKKCQVIHKNLLKPLFFHLGGVQ